MRRLNIASVAATQPCAPVARCQPRQPYPASARLLMRYIEGWAEADIAKVANAVSADYSFLDPLVGSFGRDSLADYLAVLRERVGFGSVRNEQCKVYLGAFRHPSWPGPELRFWRALPECGLAGTSDITMRAGRVSREVVCYEPSMAVERLRGSA